MSEFASESSSVGGRVRTLSDHDKPTGQNCHPDNKVGAFAQVQKLFPVHLLWKLLLVGNVLMEGASTEYSGICFGIPKPSMRYCTRFLLGKGKIAHA